MKKTIKIDFYKKQFSNSKKILLWELLYYFGGELDKSKRYILNDEQEVTISHDIVKMINSTEDIFEVIDYAFNPLVNKDTKITLAVIKIDPEENRKRFI